MRLSEITSAECGVLPATQVAFLPIGAMEGHGPHLPLGTDTYIAERCAADLTQQLGGILLPTIPFGCKTDPVRVGGTFPGLINVRATTLIAVVTDILAALRRAGIRRIVLVHAHFANLPVVYEALDQFIQQATDMQLFAGAWWDFAPEDLRNEIAAQTGTPRGRDHHAAMVETSLMMHLAPQFVQTEQFRQNDSRRHASYTILPLPDELSTPDGVIYDSTKATAQIGARLWPEILKRFAAAIQLEFQITSPSA